jgi:formate hydrogenlyase subunit 3/multisubunit Na+/H+ antiporter MnhD subunit
MEMHLFFLIILPLIAGLSLPLFRKGMVRANFALFVFLLALIGSIFLSLSPATALKTIAFIGDYNLILGLNKLSGIILIFINLFGLLICLYSKDYMQKSKFYFSLLLWLISSSNLAILSADFITFIFSWGVTLGLLYALLSFGSGYSAKKALTIVGLADFSLMLGIGLYIAATGNTAMPQQGQGLILGEPKIWVSFILMLIGALAKAGCGPFHTWIPTASEDAPVPVMAILPASLDKLLGIYLLARICMDFFVLNTKAMALLLLIGSLTIIFAVMMALIQHDLRKLLSFHAISQVGYMVLGFGTGTAIGIAGGIFHMMNHAIYKSGLFLVGGAVEQKKKTFELDKLGGLASFMPLTFISGLVFALSISGVPPFNGFASKWMIYQGTLVGLFNSASPWLRAVYVFSLIAAMFGSALTLASFIKFIHAIFLDKDNNPSKEKPSEAKANMAVPLLILAGLCVLLGVLPNLLVKNFIEPWLGREISYLGSWNSLFAFTFISLGLCAGFVLWGIFANKNIRKDSPYTGAETSSFEPAFPATEFYKTIESISPINKFYRIMKIESLDLCNILRILLNAFSYCLYILVDRLIYGLTNAAGYLVLGLSWCFRRLHSGVLDLYLAWSLAGLIIIFLILMLK